MNTSISKSSMDMKSNPADECIVFIGHDFDIDPKRVGVTSVGGNVCICCVPFESSSIYKP